jgi:integrase
LVDAAREAVAAPSKSGLDIDPPAARAKARAILLVVSLALLNGLRPFEITRLEVRDVDLAGLSIVVRGKRRGSGEAYRRLPILPVVGDLIRGALREAHGHRGRALLMGPWGHSSRWRGATLKDIGSALKVLCLRTGMEWPLELYALRHRFRTDMLEIGIPERFLNYLMGHESEGFENRGLYTDHTLHGLREAYVRAAEELARRYGIEG